MKNKFKRVITLILVFALSIAITVPAFAATKHENAQNTVVSSSLSSHLHGVTKCVKTKYGFDLYLSDADAKSTVSNGGLASPILGLIPNAAAALVLSADVALLLYDIDQQNSGTGVVIYIRPTPAGGPWAITGVEPQAIPMR